MQYIFGKVICNVINYILKVMFNSMDIGPITFLNVSCDIMVFNIVLILKFTVQLLM